MGTLKTLPPAPQDRARLPVHPHQTAVDQPPAARLARHARHEARDPCRADDGTATREHLAAAVGIQDHVLGEPRLQALDVSFLGGGEEPLQQPVRYALVGVEPRLPAPRCLRARATIWGTVTLPALDFRFSTSSSQPRSRSSAALSLRPARSSSLR
jgi:hypothetical protein